MSGRSDDFPRVQLRPLREDDLEDIYQAAARPDTSYQWRYQGTTPTRELFYQSLWTGTSAQFIVESRADGTRYGLVAAYNAVPDLGHAYVAYQRCSPRSPAGEVSEGMLLFLDYLFESTPFRKLYAEVPGYNEEVLALHQPGPLREEVSEGARLPRRRLVGPAHFCHLALGVDRVLRRAHGRGLNEPSSPPP